MTPTMNDLPKILKRLPLPCAFLESVLCSMRPAGGQSISACCFSCTHYFDSMREMDKADMEEDAAFFEQSERVNRFSRCYFEDCFCDGGHGKLVCFGVHTEGAREVWACRRFAIGKLPSDSLMRVTYENLVSGGFP